MRANGGQHDREWDDFVAGHEDGWLCQLSSWGRLLEKSFPHIRHHLLVVRGPDGVRSGLPVCQVDSWLTGHRLVSIPFASLCHPLVRDVADGRLLRDEVAALDNACRCSHFELRTMGGPGLGPHPAACQTTRFKHHFIRLDASPAELFRRFDRSCVRQRINRALASNLELRSATTDADLREFYRLYLMTRRRLGLPPQPFRFIRGLWTEFAPRGQTEVRLAAHEGTTVAGLLLLKFRNRVSAEYMVSDERFRTLSPNHLLFWDAIQTACDDGYRIFDFGRTDETNTSLMEFKGRWGTEVRDLPIHYYGAVDPATHDRSRTRTAAAL